MGMEMKIRLYPCQTIFKHAHFYYPKQLLWFIVLYFCIDVHSCFAVFVSGKVLDGLWINTSIEKIGNVSVPQLMRGYIKVQRISDFGLIFLGHSQRWGNRVFDAGPPAPAPLFLPQEGQKGLHP